DRSRDWGLLIPCSARQGGASQRRRQRCLLSSRTDCLISSTRFWVSARIDSFLTAIVPHVAFLNLCCNPQATARAMPAWCCDQKQNPQHINRGLPARQSGGR